MALPKKITTALTALDSAELWEAEDMLTGALALATPARAPVLERFRRSLKALSAAALQELEGKLDAVRREQYAKEQQTRRQQGRGPARRSSEKSEGGGWSLRLERVLCGKEGCEELHGPYWYGYRSLHGRTRKRYFGKKKPDAKKLEAATAALLGKHAAGELERSLPKKKTKGRAHVSR